MTNKLNTQDIIDVRDLIERYEALDTIRESYVEDVEDLESVSNDTGADADEQRKAFADLEGARVDLVAWDNSPMGQELAQLTALLPDLKGNGGDEEWRGDWYPVTLVRDSYFKSYAQELAEECGLVDSGARWPNTCIDWNQAARELQCDYTSCEIDGITYWYR